MAVPFNDDSKKVICCAPQAEAVCEAVSKTVGSLNNLLNIATNFETGKMIELGDELTAFVEDMKSKNTKLEDLLRETFPTH